MIPFDQETKIRGAVAFIQTMHETAGCSAKELKKLLHPKMIDLAIKILDERKEK